MTALRTCLICECTSVGTRVSFNCMDICTDCERELARLGRVWCRTGRHDVALAESNKARCKACDAARNKSSYQPYSRAEEARAYRATHAAQLRLYYARPEVRERRNAWGRADYARNPALYRARNRRRAHLHRAAFRRRYWGDPVKWRAYYRANAQRGRLRKKLAVLREWRGM